MKNLCLLLILCFAAPALADGYSNGTYSDGYVYQDGYWYLGKQAYTRQSVPYSYNAYDRYGCYRTYQGYKWQYTPYTPPAAKIEYGPGWREKVLEFAVEQDRFERAERAKAIDQNNYIEVLRELGLSGNRRVQGYGQAIGYANPFRVGGSYTYGVANYGNPGATAYSYSYNTITDLYGKSDNAVLQNQLARSVDGMQNLHGRAVDGLADLLRTEGASRERIAALLAKGQIMSRLAETLETPGEKTQTTVTQSGTGTVPVSPPPQNPGLLGLASVAERYRTQSLAVINGKCISCHGGDKALGGLDLTDPFALPADKQQAIVNRVVHSDPAKRMPLNEAHGPGEPLTAAELRALMNAFTQ